MKSNKRLRQIAKAYYIAKANVIKEGFATEIDWQYSLVLTELDEKTFLREAAWVILSSGMRESVVRNKFHSVCDAFFHWESAKKIVKNNISCKEKALAHFRHEGKINAMVAIAEHVNALGFSYVLKKIKEGRLTYLRQFPFIGPVTSLHLAKNIGLPLAKPDRHLLRIAKGLNYNCVQKLCSDISDVTDEPISVVDIVLWRYATRHYRNIERFARLLSH